MTAWSGCRLQIFADPDELARRAADWLLAAAVGSERRFAVALSGGSTPRRLYELLSSRPCREAFPWARTHWFWGDERFVPHDSPESNYRMVRDSMLSRAAVPVANIHPVPTEGLAPQDAALRYERELKTFYGAATLSADRPLFDVTFLGLGPEGHIASLFPGSALLNERSCWVGAVIGAKPEPRITLTYPALESSRAIAFLVSGAAKRRVLQQLLAGDPDLPAAHLHAAPGALHIFADRAAAPSGAP
jgi:6-phosphogluconolactonase